MSELTEIRQQLNAIATKTAAILELLGASNKPLWVRPKRIMDLTGWDKKAMQRARELGYIVFKITETGTYLYDLNTLDKRHYINKVA